MDVVTKERSENIDLIKGILIFLVVFGHVIEVLKELNIINNIYNYIYTFHMPLFIFISGLLGKKAEKQRDKVLGEVLGIYVLVSMIYTLEMLLLNGGQVTARSAILEVVQSPFRAPYATWYLLSFILWRIVSPNVVKIRYSLILAILVSLLVGTINEIESVLSLSRTFAFYPYYLLGYYVSFHKFKNYTECKTIILRLLWIPAAIGTIYIFQTMNRKGLYMRIPYSKYGYSNVDGILSRFLIMNIACINSWLLLWFISGMKSKFISKIGRNSLSVYIGHILIMPLVMKYGREILFLNQYIVLLLALIAAIAITVILSSEFVNRFIFIVQRKLKFCIIKSYAVRGEGFANITEKF